MEKHIKKCFKCPQNLKKVLQLGTVTVVEQPFQKKIHYEPLLVQVDDFNDISAVPSTSSASEPKPSSFSDTATSKSPKGKGTPSFFDHMDLQTNVSKYYTKCTHLIRPRPISNSDY